MRAVEAQDYWRALSRTASRDAFATVAIQGLLGVADHEFHVNSRMFALCGPNGSCKSSILNAIYTACSGEISEVFSSRISDSTVQVDLVRNGLPVRKTFPPSPDQNSSDTIILDGSIDIFGSISWLRSVENLEELLEAFGPSEATEEESRNLSYTCGKDYYDIRFYELEEVDGQNTMPFFSVRTQDGSYDARTMGLGEYSIFYMHWLLRQAEVGSLVFIEEPENYIPPKAQWALMDVLAKVSVQRRIFVALTTHSEHIVDKLPIPGAFYTRKSAQGYRVIPVAKDAKHLISIGVNPIKKDILLVEDRAAREFLKAMLLIFGEDIHPSFEIAIAGSAGAIEKNLSDFPKEGHSHIIVGVHDADVNDYKGKAEPTNWKRLFLPGTGCPEREVKGAIEQDLSGAAAAFSVTEDDFVQALDLAAGADIHDFPHIVADALALSKSQFWLFGVRHWLELGGHYEEARRLVVEIVEVLGS